MPASITLLLWPANSKDIFRIVAGEIALHSMNTGLVSDFPMNVSIRDATVNANPGGTILNKISDVETNDLIDPAFLIPTCSARLIVRLLLFSSDV